MALDGEGMSISAVKLSAQGLELNDNNNSHETPLK